MEVKLSASAKEEVQEAARYYEAEVSGLGRAFLDKVKIGISEIKDFPEAGRIIQGKFRRHLLVRFPYGIIYEICEDHIFISAIMHLKRKPGYWQDR